MSDTPDFHRSGNTWNRIDVLGDATDVAERLRELGWEHWITVGDGDAEALGVHVWTGPAGYLLELSNTSAASPFVQVDTFPELMRLLSEWAPALTMLTTIDLIGSGTKVGSARDTGLIEQIAAKAAFGARQDGAT